MWEPNTTIMIAGHFWHPFPSYFLWHIRFLLLHKKEQILSLATLGFGKDNILEASCKRKTEVH